MDRFHIVDYVDDLEISTADCTYFYETAVFDEDWDMIWCYRTKTDKEAIEMHNYVMWHFITTGELPHEERWML